MNETYTERAILIRKIVSLLTRKIYNLFLLILFQIKTFKRLDVLDVILSKKKIILIFG